MVKFKWNALLFVVFLPTSALAQCLKIENDLDRLACYDKESGRTAKTEILPAVAGKWLVHSETSKLTDLKSITMNVESDEVVNCGWNKGGHINLAIRCHEATTSLILTTECHMTSSEYNSYGTVAYRIDDEKAAKANMIESTDNRSLGLWTGGRSIPLIKSMLGKQKIVVQATPYGENQFTATFNIAGLETAITPLRKECGW